MYLIDIFRFPPFTWNISNKYCIHLSLYLSAAWLCQQRSWYGDFFVTCRPSSVSQLSQNLLSGFLSNFSCCLPWALDFFWILKKCIVCNFARFFRFFYLFVNLGPYRAKTLQKMLLLPSNHFWYFSNSSRIFFSVILTKVLFWFLIFFPLRCFPIFWRKFLFHHLSYK